MKSFSAAVTLKTSVAQTSNPASHFRCAHVQLEYRIVTPLDALECVRIRGLTRLNAVSVQRLAALGITAESWANDTRSEKLGTGQLMSILAWLSCLGADMLLPT
jgi:hypothetical protein